MICFSSLDTVLNKSRFWRFFGKLPFRIPLFTRDVFSYVRSWTMLIRGINQCMNYNGSTKFKPNMLGICGNFLSVLSNVYQISSLAHAVFEGIFFFYNHTLVSNCNLGGLYLSFIKSWHFCMGAVPM